MEVNEDILMLYLKDELSVAERAEVSRQLEQNNALFHQYIQLKDVWDYSGLKTNIHQYDTNAEWEKLSQKIPVYSGRKYMLTRIAGIAGVAAALVVAFFIGQLVNITPGNELAATGVHVFTAPEGQITKLTLADGSTVVLNEGSRLSVPLNFGDEERSVELSGEGYFEVTKNKEQVFSVKSGKQEVKVLGTVFNIRAYPGEDKMITTLEEGIVRWEMESQHITLKPGMQVVYDVNLGQVEQNNVDVNGVKQWAEGRYRYEDATFEEVIAVIERWYGVRVEWQPTDFTGQHYNGVIKRSASLPETLDLLKVMIPIDYTINGQKVIIKRMR